MKLYLLKRIENEDDYVEYDITIALIISASTVEHAIEVSNTRHETIVHGHTIIELPWNLTPEEIEVTCIGESFINEAKIILASYRHG